MRTFTETHLETGPALDVGHHTASVDPFSEFMLGAAFKENLKQGAAVAFKVLFGLGVVVFLGPLLAQWITLSFYEAWSAGLVLVYLANLADVKRFRDAVSVIVPGIMVFMLLAYGAGSPMLVGLSLFTHVSVAFFAGLNQISGSLKDLGLWSFLFGVNGAIFSSYAVLMSG